METVTQTSAIYIPIYGVIAFLYLLEAFNAVRKMRYMIKHELLKSDSLLYGFFMGTAIATLLMCFRTIANIFICDPVPLTILRIVSNSMIIYVLFMASRMQWAIKMKALDDNCINGTRGKK